MLFLWASNLKQLDINLSSSFRCDASSGSGRGVKAKNLNANCKIWVKLQNISKIQEQNFSHLEKRVLFAKTLTQSVHATVFHPCDHIWLFWMWYLFTVLYNLKRPNCSCHLFTGISLNHQNSVPCLCMQYDYITHKTISDIRKEK